MASPKIGKSSEGKTVSSMTVAELTQHASRGGKNAAKAINELRKRGVAYEVAEV